MKNYQSKKIEKIKEENAEGKHQIIKQYTADKLKDIYSFNDFKTLQNFYLGHSYNALESLEDLLEREEQRKKDGFHPKIKLGKIARPKKGGGEEFVIIPTAEEEKFYHDLEFKNTLNNSLYLMYSDDADEEELDAVIGSGKGEEEEIIYEEPLYGARNLGGGKKAGDEEDEHEKGIDPYELGKLLTEKFELPNIKDKGRKKSLTKYTYDLTDKNKKEGQILDKKSTIHQIIKRNIGLGRIKEGEEIDPTKLLVSPKDHIYRILSKEKDYEAQAIVFFLRDYSGSMMGNPTEIIVAQHLLIYSWLVYQYQNRVSSRFIVHDVKAKEIPTFYEYYNLSAAGGTDISSSFSLVNKIVEEENLAQNNNIYVFYGGDGEDGTKRNKSIIELEKMLKYANRVGITIVDTWTDESVFENVLEKSKILERHEELIKLNLLLGDADQDGLIKGIKELIA